MAVGPLVVHAVDLLRRPGSERTVQLQVSGAELELDDPRLDTDRPVSLDLRLEALTDGVLVHGTVTAHWRGTCRRCLVDVGGDAVAVVDERYELRPSDPDVFPLLDDQIDLKSMAAQLVLLELPTAPLCREDCAGLCPLCGVDRNATTCDCVVDPGQSVWSVLDRLRGPDTD
jgi:uncharacterized protein